MTTEGNIRVIGDHGEIVLNVRDLPNQPPQEEIVTNISNENECGNLIEVIGPNDRKPDVENGGENDVECCSNCSKACLLIAYILFWTLVYFTGITVVIAISPIVIAFIITGFTVYMIVRISYQICLEERGFWAKHLCVSIYLSIYWSQNQLNELKNTFRVCREFLYVLFNCLDTRYHCEGCKNVSMSYFT